MKDLQTINQSNPFLSIAPVGDYAFFVVDRRLLCMSLHTGDQFPLTRFCAESGRILTVQKVFHSGCTWQKLRNEEHFRLLV